VIVDLVAAGGPAHMAGIRRGDEILGVEQESVSGKSPEEAIRLLSLGVGEQAKLLCRAVNDSGQTVDGVAVLNYGVASVPSVIGGILPGNVWYFRFTHINDERQLGLFAAKAKEMWESSGGEMKGIIIDLRDCPGGLVEMAQKFAGTFIRSGAFARLRTRAGEETLEVQPFFCWMPEAGDKAAEVALRFYRAPMVVLVNESTCSAAEALAMALSERGRAALVGTRTWGKGAAIATRELGYGGKLEFVSGTMFSPHGFNYEGIGITPVHEVAQPRQQKQDRQLASALEIVKNKPELPDTDDTVPMPTSLGWLYLTLVPLLVVLVGLLVFLRRRRRARSQGTTPTV
jgi:carboxyl-terminal processing protease